MRALSLSAAFFSLSINGSQAQTAFDLSQPSKSSLSQVSPLSPISSFSGFSSYFASLGKLEPTFVPPKPECLTDDECWGKRPEYPGAAPLYCIERRCQDPSSLPFAPIVRKRTGIKAKLDGFKLREGEELNKMFESPKPQFYPREHAEKDLEFYDGTDELVQGMCLVGWELCVRTCHMPIAIVLHTIHVPHTH